MMKKKQKISWQDFREDFKKRGALILGAVPFNDSPATPKCFICQETLVGKALPLAKSIMPYSRSKTMSKVGQLLGQGYLIIVSEDDMLCLRCTNLINQMDKLEFDLEIVKKPLVTFLKKKYNISTKLSRQRQPSPQPPTAAMREKLARKEENGLKSVLGQITPLSGGTEAREIPSDKEGGTSVSVNKRGNAGGQFPSMSSLVSLSDGNTSTASSRSLAKRQSVCLYKCVHCTFQSDYLIDVKQHIYSCAGVKTYMHRKNSEGLATQKQRLSKVKESKFLVVGDKNNVDSNNILSFVNDHQYTLEDKGVFECNICKFHTSDKTVFGDHCREHIEFKNFVCKVCNKRFEKKYSLNNHLKIHKTSKVLKCGVCFNVFSKGSDLIKHLQEHSKLFTPKVATGEVVEGSEVNVDNHCLSVVTENEVTRVQKLSGDYNEPQGRNCNEIINEDTLIDYEVIIMGMPSSDTQPHKLQFQCKNCMYVTDNKLDLVIHCQRHHATKKYHCNICKKKFLFKNYLTVHTMQFHNEQYAWKGGPGLEGESKNGSSRKEKVYACALCYLKSSSRQQLLLHFKEHKSNGFYNCSTCRKKYKFAANLIKHRSKCCPKEKIECIECKKVFQNSTQLKNHRKVFHRDPFCSTCNKEITNPIRLKKHEARHEKGVAEAEMCHICGQIYKTRNGFLSHMARHTGKFKYHCSHCKKGFPIRGRLVEHLSTHTKETRFTCNICDKKFYYRSTYWAHRRQHDDPYPYTCDICGQKFRYAHHRVNHRRRHTGDRPYKCMFCSSRFNTTSSLTIHMMKHTGKYPYNCKICKKGFSTREKITRHEKTHKLIPQSQEKNSVPEQETENQANVPAEDMLLLGANVNTFCDSSMKCNMVLIEDETMTVTQSPADYQVSVVDNASVCVLTEMNPNIAELPVQHETVVTSERNSEVVFELNQKIGEENLIFVTADQDTDMEVLIDGSDQTMSVESFNKSS